MNLYLLENDKREKYATFDDTFDSMVVSAMSEKEAIELSWSTDREMYQDWTKTPIVKLIGLSFVEEGIVCQSYNAS